MILLVAFTPNFKENEILKAVWPSTWVIGDKPALLREIENLGDL